MPCKPGVTFSIACFFFSLYTIILPDFRGGREQAHNFVDLGALPKSKTNKEKPPFCLIF